MRFILFIFIAIAFNISFTTCKVSDYASDSEPVSHEIWDSLLREHVTEAGNVDYQGFIRDSLKLNKYLDLLSKNHPNDKNWNKEAQLAYWINAYNAFTVKLIVNHYPIQSIKDIKKGIPFVNTVWDIKFIKIEDRTYDLNNIEHGIIRSKFKDPRIHAAVNCASISCPKLQNRAFTGNQLNEQLDQAARDFINDKSKNDITAQKAMLSSIFNWYRMDFDSVRDFINQYSSVKLTSDTKIDYLEYDWNLNEK